jgi:hypothetical protein
MIVMGTFNSVRCFFTTILIHEDMIRVLRVLLPLLTSTFSKTVRHIFGPVIG